MNANRVEALFAMAHVRSHSEHNQIQSSNVLEMTPVEGGELAASVTGGRGNNEVVIPRHLSGSLCLCPDSCVFPRDFIRVGNDWEECEHRFQISLSSRAVFGRGAFHPVPQLRKCDSGDFDFLGRVEREPAAQIERALLAADNNIRIEDYCHLSSGALKATRDCRRSSAHARASSGERSVAASARASSAPVQLSTGVGTNRATGTDASRTTKVVFSRRARATHSASPDPAPASAMFVSFMAPEYTMLHRRAKPDNLTL